MSVKELVQAVEELSQEELLDMANYIAYVRFCAWQTKQVAVTAADDLGMLYAEFTSEDHVETEIDRQDYLRTLQAEDVI